jgi:hypothetical protein
MKETLKILAITMNAGLLAIFYTIFGGILSYVLYYIFDEHDDVWEDQPTWWQVSTVGLEIISIAVVGLWSALLIRDAPPIFHVSKEWDIFVDTYVSGVFFAFAMFLFLDNMQSKLMFLYRKFLGNHNGHLLTRKTNEKKTT